MRLYVFCFNLILGLDIVGADDNALLFQSAEEHASEVAQSIIGERQVRGYKSNLLKKQRQEAAAAAAALAAQNGQTTQAPTGKKKKKCKGKGCKPAPTLAPPVDSRGQKGQKGTPSIIQANENGKIWIGKAAENHDITQIRGRLEEMTDQAKKWITNNIGKFGQKELFKARRLVERYEELPDRYMQVVGRCRDPSTLDELDELRKSRPVRKEKKAEIKEQRSLERKEKVEEKAAKQQEREMKRQEKAEAADNESGEESEEAERKRREAEGERKGNKFRPGRVEKKPLRYWQYLRQQILRKKLQRNELKCDPELYPECSKKGKPGQQARQKFRPDPREAMWTKIHRGLRLAPLEVRNECHIWAKLEKKTKKLKIKTHNIYLGVREKFGGEDDEKLSKKQILNQQNQQKKG